jgi:flagellar hook-associated protein 1 FlgK
MSASALMSTGTQAIFAAYRQVQTTANNIANANTPGYSRQTVQLQTNGSQLVGGGYIGRGVSVADVTRASNRFLTGQTNALTAASATDTARANTLDQLQKVFGKTTTGLGYAATQVFSAYADLAAAPSDLSARQAVLGRLEDFASLARSTNQGIDDLQTQLQDDVKGSVAEANGIAQSLAKLNVQISTATNAGHDPNDLLDQRDQLISQLSGLIETHAVMGPDGQASVFVASGESLVLGAHANALVAQPDSIDPSRLNMGIQLESGLTMLSRGVTGEGRIPGLLQAQNNDLTAARNDLGQLVTSVAMTLNSQQAHGLDLSGGAGSPLFSINPPVVSSALTNAKDATGHYISSMNAVITDPTQLKASDYVIEADPANVGTYIVTRQSDGLVRSGVTSGTELDGFRLSDGANTPAPGEQFLLKPVAAAAGNLTVALRNPLGLAAANPVTAAAATSNTGTLAVSSVNITAAPASAYAGLVIRFADDAGSYDILDSTGATLASGSYTAGAPISHDGMDLSLSGLPRLGDKILVSPTVHVASSNGNALTMQGMGELKLVGGQTVSDAFDSTLSDMGVRTQSAQASATNSGQALQRAKAQLTGETGVNLDEEAARLIQYQQGYQAAAKVLQTAQTMLDTVIQLGR